MFTLMEKSLREIIEVENVIRPRSSVLGNPRIQGAPVSAGFKMEDGPQIRSANIVNIRNERNIRKDNWYLESFDRYETYYDPDSIRSGIQSTRLNFK